MTMGVSATVPLWAGPVNSVETADEFSFGELAKSVRELTASMQALSDTVAGVVQAQVPAIDPGSGPTASNDEAQRGTGKRGKHTVKSGDSLRKIAEANDTTWQAIYELNRGKIDDPDLIFPRQVFVLPNDAKVENGRKQRRSPAESRTVDLQPQAQPAADDSRPSNKQSFVHPLEGEGSTSSRYGAPRENSSHRGHDLAAAAGTRIVAAAAGTVVASGSDSDGYGNYVKIDHGDGRFTLYAHMLNKPDVAKGSYVDAGQKIGKVGSTGNSTGNHLHFEMMVGGPTSRVNPAPFLNGDKRF